MSFTVRAFEVGDESAVLQLWRDCGLLVPWNNPLTDMQRKLADSPDLFFVGEAGGQVLASCMAGYDGHRGWVYYLAVSQEYRHLGYARHLMTHAESVLARRGCAKVELMVRDSNEPLISFYENIGYALEPVVVMSKRLSWDEPHDHC